MKRSQKEIKMICEEIRLAVKLALLREEQEKQEKEIREMQHEFTLCYDPLYGAYFSVNKEMLNAQIEALNMRMKLEDYRKGLETL